VRIEARLVGAVAIRQETETELAHANESMRQDVLGGAPQELRCGERHKALFVST
jgi:hypothetical protein